MKNQGHNVTTLNNPELIYKAFNFVKPANLLPQYNNKLYLIKQLGISESGTQTNYVINPYFFGFKICFDIFVTSLFCSESDKTIEEGLVKILTDKYGTDYNDIYKYVSFVARKFINEGRKNQDEEDETFIAGIQTISGINNKKVLYSMIYESAMMTASRNAWAFKS